MSEVWARGMSSLADGGHSKRRPLRHTCSIPSARLPPSQLYSSFLAFSPFSPSSSASTSSSRAAMLPLHRQPRLLRTRAVRGQCQENAEISGHQRSHRNSARDSHPGARPSLGPNLTPILRYSTPPHRAPPAQITHSLPISHGRVLRPTSSASAFSSRRHRELSISANCTL